MGQIKVELSIPIRGDGCRDKVVFKRSYMETQTDSMLNSQFGRIIDMRSTGLTILPHIRFPEGVAPDYRVTLSIDNKISDTEAQNDLPTLSFVDECKFIDHTPEMCRNFDTLGNRIDDITCVTKQWDIAHNFTAIAVNYKGTDNLLIPLMNEGGGSKSLCLQLTSARPTHTLNTLLTVHRPDRSTPQLTTRNCVRLTT